MNIYIVVEGEVGEKKVYKHWVPLVNPNLSYVEHISQIERNNFVIVSGGGYPQYYEVIESAVEDVNNYQNIDRLVISCDSEEMEFDEKRNEISEFITRLHCVSEIRIIIQHFCLETWGLANRVVVRQHPHSPKLREYMNFFNVRNKDPELLPAYQPEELNRAQFAVKYLRRALNEKFRNLTYTKSNPRQLLHHKYFDSVKRRLEETGHVSSFKTFLDAFV